MPSFKIIFRAGKAVNIVKIKGKGKKNKKMKLRAG